jgi:uncharacterized protein with HEPN domain
MSERDPQLYLRDIQQALNNIGEFSKDLSQKSNVDAISYNAIILGEATTHLSTDFKKKHPQIRWELFKTLRNISAHSYHMFDVERFVKLMHKDKAQLQKMLDEELKR